MIHIPLTYRTNTNTPKGITIPKHVLHVNRNKRRINRPTPEQPTNCKHTITSESKSVYTGDPVILAVFQFIFLSFSFIFPLSIIARIRRHPRYYPEQPHCKHTITSESKYYDDPVIVTVIIMTDSFFLSFSFIPISPVNYRTNTKTPKIYSSSICIYWRVPYINI